MGVAASSSSSSSSSKKYEVFLSFRGEDTRKSFTSHLHTALCLKGIETFIDYELPKGDDISQSLIQTIQDSSLSVIVFSEKYATSKWCLNELIEILRCKEEKGQLVVPIFYQVDPSHVRHQRGAYEEAFAQHLKKNPDKVNDWRKALFETANLAGWDSCTCRDEAELIQNIVSDIIKKLNHGSSSTLANIVGIDENCDVIESFLEGFSSIGIWGMGGMGKTTMAKVVFAKFRSQFDSSYFLENLGEVSKMHGLQYIRDKLINELSNDRSLKGISRRRVLIVLDDVSDTRQLDYLENEVPPFIRHGSKVIITSRDMHILKGRVERIHKATKLGHDNSLELFNLKAFRNDGYKSEYKELVERALAYAQGVPLALTVLGSFLYSLSIEEWKSALSRLKKTTLPNIQDVLKLSYDRLLHEEKEVFLDIACFLRGKSEKYVLAMLESCGFHVHISLRTLMDKALISIDHSVVWMHDLIQSMAFEIVHQEYLTSPERCRRLVNPNDIYDVLKNNRGSGVIQGISLDMSEIGDLELSADSFKKMTNLRFLKFYSSWDQRSCTVNLPSGLDSFSKSLSYLQWNNFPLESLPLSFCVENLVTLHMPNSRIKKLWDGVQNLVNLREINLTSSKYLMELPDISRAQNLNELRLGFCSRLKSLKAERLPKSIKTIVVSCCIGVKEFSFSSNKVERLYLGEMNIEILDLPIGGMEKVKELRLDCSKLKNFPIDAIGCMRSLLDLRLFNCNGMIDEAMLHNLFDSLLSVETIYLTGSCKLTELPHNIKNLSRLKYLGVCDCKRLQSLPKLPPSIEELNASNCTSLYSLDLATAPPVAFLHLTNCWKLGNRYTESACFPLKQAIYTRKACEICYPGRRVPKWFKSNQGIDASNNISIELPSTISDLVGFVLCSVLSHFAYHEHLQCQLYYDGKKHKCSKFHKLRDFDSHHVLLWCVSDMFINFGKTMDDQNTNYRPNVSFEFSVVTGSKTDSEKFVDGVIEACGVCPIYASKYPKFIQQMELEANLGAQKETCQDLIEQEKLKVSMRTKRHRNILKIGKQRLQARIKPWTRAIKALVS